MRNTLNGLAVSVVVALVLGSYPTSVHAQNPPNIQACIDAETRLNNDEGALSQIGDSLNADAAAIQFDGQYYPDNVPGDEAMLAADQIRYYSVLQMVQADTAQVGSACPHGH